MVINFDLMDLQVFLAVKDTGSFHAAAERLNLSQPAITRRIKKLEEALDSTLFERTTRAVRPTLAAKRLQARAEMMIETAQDTALAMRDESVAFAFQRNAIVTIATIPTVISPILTKAIGACTEDTPRVRLLDGSANEVAEAVAAGEADFGLCSVPLQDPATQFEPLFEDPMVLVAPKDHPLSTQDVVDWADLQDVPLILPARGTGNRLLIDEAMAQARITHPWSFEVRRTSSTLDMVRQGMGAGLVPRSAVSGDDLALCSLPALHVVRSVGLLSRLGQVDRPAVARLKSAVRQVCEGKGRVGSSEGAVRPLNISDYPAWYCGVEARNSP